jgi:peptidoglycan/xylan/chitin deacetylase (PgdA/CDA1 family)
MRYTVLAYHAVGSCPYEHDPHSLYLPTDQFAQQMDFLKRKRAVVALEEIVRGNYRGRRAPVAITFDDAYRSVMRNAFPILEEHGFPATVFVPTLYMGGTNSWLPPSECDFEIMSEDELREVQKRGFSIESHGHAHINYGKSSYTDALADLEVAADDLLRVTGRPTRYFAYPFGSESQTARDVIAAGGIEAAFTIDARHRGPQAAGRVPVQPQDQLITFALKTSGYWLPVRRGPAGPVLRTLLSPLLRRNRSRSGI